MSIHDNEPDPTMHGGVTASQPTAETRWVPVGDGAELMVHLHLPDDGEASSIVVLCGALGRDHGATDRSLRALGTELARRHMVALRFHWSGTLESGRREGSDQGLGARWRDDLRAVIEWAREATGLSVVHLVGLRLGSVLAQDVANAAECDVDTVVLWEPVAQGKSWVRQQQSLLLMSPHYAEVARTEPVPEGCVELPGELLCDPDLQDMRSLRLHPPSTTGARHTVVVIRPEPRDHKQLRPVLEHPEVTVHRVEGQDQMLDHASTFTMVPTDTIDLIASELSQGSSARRPFQAPPPRLEAVVCSRSAGQDSPAVGVVEEIVDVHGLPGVLTHAVGRCRGSLVVAPAAGEPRQGPSGLWVQLARDLAAHGWSTLRVDAHGFGEASVRGAVMDPWPYRRSIIEDYATAARWVHERTGHAPATLGSCAGAWVALRVALEAPVSRVLAVNLIAWTVSPANDRVGPRLLLNRAAAQLDSTATGPWSHRLRVKAGMALALYAPYPLAQWLGSHDVISLPSPLLTRVVRRGVRVHQIQSQRDFDYVLRLRGQRGQDRMAAQGLPSEVTILPTMDHALFMSAGRRDLIELVTAELVAASADP